MATVTKSKLSECDPGDEQIITELHNIITQENVAGYDKDCLKQLASGCALLIKPLEEALLSYCLQSDLKRTSAKRKAELKILITTNNLKMGQWVQKAGWINKQISLLLYAQTEGVTPGGSDAEEDSEVQAVTVLAEEEDEGEQDGDDNSNFDQITSTATQRTQAANEEQEQPAAPAGRGDRSGSSKQAAIPGTRRRAPAAREDTVTADEEQEQLAAPAGRGDKSGSSKQAAIPRPQAPAAVSESRVSSLESRLMYVENTQALRRAVPQFTGTDSDETVQQQFTANVPFKLRSSKSNMLYDSAALLSSDWFSSDGIQVRAYIGEQAVSPTEVVFKAAYSLLNDVRRSAAAEKGSDIGTCPFIEWLKDPSLSVPVSSDFNFDPTVTY